MKKYIALITIACSILSSCVKDADPIFDESASKRLAERLNEFKSLLTSNTNGWLVEYYPHSTQMYGGFNLYFKFDGGEVTVKALKEEAKLDEEVKLNEAEATSLYSLGEDMGPTLNFDTYNIVLNYFSDPSFYINGKPGSGLQGDYEFIYMSGNEQEIILKGKKTKNVIRMIPFPASETWENFSQSIVEMKNRVIAPAYAMTVNGNSITNVSRTTSQFLNITNTTESEGDPALTVTEKYSAPFIVTTKGIRFYQPITINDIEIQEFIFNPQNERLEAGSNTFLSLIFPSPAGIFVSNTIISTNNFKIQTK